MWDGRATLSHHRGRRFEAKLSGFVKQADDLVVFEKLSAGTNESATELAWMPQNRDTSVQIFGGSVSMTAYIANRFEAQIRYTHEIHRPKIGEWIAYRPNDFADLNAVFHLPSDFRIELSGGYRGSRYLDETTDETLGRYVLLKPKLSKIIENRVGLFVGGNFAIGTYMLLDGYALAQDNLDFGLELKF